MAFVGSTNNTMTPASIAQDFCYTLKTALVNATWTIQGSSAGTPLNFANNSSTDYVPNYASWATAGSWVRLREPSGAGGREYVIMRGTGTGIIIKYSRSSGFSTGGGQTTLPTTGAGGDGVVWWGTTPGFSATGAGTNTYDLATTTTAQQVVLTISSSGYISCTASNTAVNGVYGFWLFAYASGSGTFQFSAYTEAVAATSCSPLDYDPSFRQFTGGNWWGYNNATANLCHYWQGYPSSWVSPTVNASYQLNGAGFTYFVWCDGALIANIANAWPPNTATVQALNPYDGKYGLFPNLISAQAVVGVTPKGVSTGSRWLYGAMNNIDTLDLTTSTPYIAYSASNFANGAFTAVYPWVPNVLPLV